MRINQIAREHHLGNKEVLSFLASIGISGKSHSSSIDEETQDRILIHFGLKEDAVDEEALQPSRFKRLKRPRGWKPKPEEEKEE
ncbi:MAG: translation initiation factor IF-2 N-terminal domain-containing protein, partial [bacterium]